MLVTSYVSSHYVNKQAWPRICERQYNDTTMDYRFTDDEREQIDIPKVKLTMSVQSYMYEPEFFYLVKWHDFPESDSTWEPTGHIDEESLQNYECPIIWSDRLSYAAKLFEDTVHQRLRCKESAIRFDLDVYRYCFLTDEKLLVNGVEDLKRLPMSDNWYYRINDKGRGLKLCFPLTLIPKLQHKKVYFKSNGILQEKIVQFETVCMLSANEVCNLDKL
ncbi:unnamed protein product [Mytilus edulis]|uniref:Chromo domain-containing protein n=1 Tax=Mytilus edulis TaxID=6550 RepID=A0A8S3R482_MYTED|nr:unnamed protein product [Mytilus edulis]